MASDLDLVDYLIKGIAALAAWFLVILGWSAVNDLTVQRERRKLDEAKIDQLRKAISEVEDLAVQHHVSEYDDARARKITRKVKTIGLECSHLERCGIIGRDWRAVNIQVKRAVTMTNFERSGHQTKSLGDDLVAMLEGSFDKFHIFLMHSLESKMSESEPMRTTLLRILKKL